MGLRGRPMKGKSRRAPITVHVPVGLLDAIDEYVEQRDDTETGAYSRSDFFCAAALAHLKSLGLDTGGVEADVRLERTENVPKTGANKNGQKNTAREGGENREK